MSEKRRFGQFVVADTFFDYKHMENMAMLLSGMVVLKVDFEPCRPAKRYYAWSPQFDEIEEGCVTPEYMPIITVHDDSEGFDVKWERLS